jgi:coproporphyrinogen III oxidase-like Fe-S oxidoreductase
MSIIKDLIAPARGGNTMLEAGAVIDAPEISPTDYLLETLMLGLRLAEGIDLSQFKQEILNQIWTCLQPYYRQGWVEITANDGQVITVKEDLSLSKLSARLRLNDPEGFLFSNTILAALFEKLE